MPNDERAQSAPQPAVADSDFKIAAPLLRDRTDEAKTEMERFWAVVDGS